jgi:hypothetical protein
MESLPKTGTGKILKRDLRKKYWQGRETMRSPCDESQGNAAAQNAASGQRDVRGAPQNK